MKKTIIFIVSLTFALASWPKTETWLVVKPTEPRGSLWQTQALTPRDAGAAHWGAPEKGIGGSSRLEFLRMLRPDVQADVPELEPFVVHPIALAGVGPTAIEVNDLSWMRQIDQRIADIQTYSFPQVIAFVTLEPTLNHETRDTLQRRFGLLPEELMAGAMHLLSASPSGNRMHDLIKLGVLRQGLQGLHVSARWEFFHDPDTAHFFHGRDPATGKRVSIPAAGYQAFDPSGTLVVRILADSPHQGDAEKDRNRAHEVMEHIVLGQLVRKGQPLSRATAQKAHDMVNADFPHLIVPNIFLQESPQIPEEKIVAEKVRPRPSLIETATSQPVERREFLFTTLSTLFHRIVPEGPDEASKPPELLAPTASPHDEMILRTDVGREMAKVISDNVPQILRRYIRSETNAKERKALRKLLSDLTQTPLHLRPASEWPKILMRSTTHAFVLWDELNPEFAYIGELFDRWSTAGIIRRWVSWLRYQPVTQSFLTESGEQGWRDVVDAFLEAVFDDVQERLIEAITVTEKLEHLFASEISSPKVLESLLQGIGERVRFNRLLHEAVLKTPINEDENKGWSAVVPLASVGPSHAHPDRIFRAS